MLKMEFFTLLSDSVNRIAELCRIRPCVTWDIVMYRVNQTLDRIDMSSMELLYINKTLSKKGHNYVTVVCDQDRLIIFICEGKSSKMVDCIIVGLEAHNGKRENIEFVSYDFGEAYPSRVRRNFPNAKIVYDEFHAMEFVIEAMNDTVGRAIKSQAIKARYQMRMKISKLSGE